MFLWKWKLDWGKIGWKRIKKVSRIPLTDTNINLYYLPKHHLDEPTFPF